MISTALEALRAPQQTGHLDLLIAEGGGTDLKLLTAVIASLELRSTGVDEDELLAALRLVRQLAGTEGLVCGGHIQPVTLEPPTQGR